MAAAPTHVQVATAVAVRINLLIGSLPHPWPGFWKTPVHEPSNGEASGLLEHLEGGMGPCPRAFGARARTGLAHNQRGYLAVGEHLVGLAAKEQPIDAAAAMRGHHDQVAALLQRGRDDALGRV